MRDREVPWIVDVDESNFELQVLAGSAERPVLVDFWAAWCGPCRMLKPVLEQLAREYEGRFLLARLDTERAPALALRYRVQSIPYVVLFRDGKPVDQFLGARPEAEVKRFLARHIPSERDALARRALELLEAGESEQAAPLLEQVLEQDPRHPLALLGRATLAFEAGQWEAAGECLGRIDPGSPEAERAEPLRARIALERLCREAGGAEVCQRRLEEEPDSLEARYHHACCRAAAGQYRQALEELLEIVSRDRHGLDEAPRRAMLEIFKAVGDRSALAEEYRTRLARAIF